MCRSAPMRPKWAAGTNAPMCGRIALFSPPTRLARRLRADLGADLDPDGAASWNVAPTTEILGVRTVVPRDQDPVELNAGRRVLDRYRWGLVPSWARDISTSSRMFNARAEGVLHKPSFRAAFRRRRLVIPADGFFEWDARAGRHRQPSYFSARDGEPIAFAGLWETWRNQAVAEGPDRWLHSCTIITTDAGPDLDSLHDRMPVVLDDDGIDAWLDPGAPLGELGALLVPAPPGTLRHHQVDRRVGNVANDDPGLVAPLDGPVNGAPAGG
jgi:putative SOS response-associated peptidase YedK